MLYLINETFYNKERNEILDILKIGYTSDIIKSGSRYTTYLNHCPEAKLLYEIPGGTLDHEAALLSKFHHLLYKGQEWFYYDQEIIDYFETHRTLDSLSDLILPEDRSYAEIRKYCDKYLSLLLNDRVENGCINLEQAAKSSKSMLDSLMKRRFKNYWQINKYFLNVFNFNISDYCNLSEKVAEFLVQFDSYTQFTDKMKYLCDNVTDLSEEEFSSILGSIDIIFKNYFLTLGKERIRALQYRKYALDSEYQRQKNNQFNSKNLDDIIYFEFKIGEKYLKSYIKQRLGEIYESLGLRLSPKATDLEKYFEVNKTQVTNKETGKRDSGYELISRKKD